jgi:hypothetical protein
MDWWRWACEVDLDLGTGYNDTGFFLIGAMVNLSSTDFLTICLTVGLGELYDL